MPNPRPSPPRAPRPSRPPPPRRAPAPRRARGSRGREALSRFIRRVWREDVAPLLRDEYARQRRAAARLAAKGAAAAGAVLDGMLRRRGAPLSRFLTVLGASLGALLPDVWRWSWLRSAPTAARRRVDECVQRRAGELSDREALELFDLPTSATREQLRRSWRAAAQRWHPDRAPDDRRRTEYQLRFVAYRAAYDRLVRSYDAGRLPR